MTNFAQPLFPLGKTRHEGQDVPTDAQIVESAGLLGAEHEFPVDEVPTGRMQARVRTNQSSIYCMAVRNSSGIALLPGYIVSWKTGTRFKEVDGYVTTTGGEAAGVVDPYLKAAGCRDNDVFWLVRRGVVNVKTSLAGDAENVITEGDILYALTAATSQATTAGRVISFAATTGTTLALQQLYNRIGRAMSAKTTANTNADVLTDVTIHGN